MDVQFRQRTLAMLACCALVVTVAGCRASIGFIRAFLGDTPVQSVFEKQTDVDLCDGKHRLLILCSAAHSITEEEASLPLDIVAGISARLRPKGVEIVDPDDVLNWLDDHGSWDDLGALGAHFDADYIAVVHLRGLSYREPESTNLYRCYANGQMRVFEIVDENSTPWAAERFSSAINETYPAQFPINADKTSEKMFRKQAMDHLYDLLARHFHSYRQSETI